MSEHLDVPIADADSGQEGSSLSVKKSNADLLLMRLAGKQKLEKVQQILL